MSLSMNFLSEPLNQRLSWLVLALGAMSVWAGADTLFTMQDELRGLQQKLREQGDARRSALRRPLPDKSMIEANALAQGIAAEIRYPWAQVLRELEASQGDGVLMKAFEHNQSKATTRLELQATTTARFQEVIRRLKDASGEEYGWTIASLSRNEQGYRIGVNGKANK
ncbi:hypothetical protein [Pigmentiphaga sp. CHJ604]|uniref:hypothetical protein n=1 Tax=Pigmentiphaga sp. CHJ604 TaxID=3081984 RepID=UPI0030CCC852